jgi:hypothetical protein
MVKRYKLLDQAEDIDKEASYINAPAEVVLATDYDTVEFFHSRYHSESEASHERKDARIEKLEAALRYCEFHMVDTCWPKDHPMLLAVRKALSSPASGGAIDG